MEREGRLTKRCCFGLLLHWSRAYAGFAIVVGAFLPEGTAHATSVLIPSNFAHDSASSSSTTAPAPAAAMDIARSFHMNDGENATSYAKNSALQKGIIGMTNHITMELLKDLYMKTESEKMVIADLGCSSGPNSLSVVRDMVKTVADTCRENKPMPEFLIFLNDLPSNDFNSLFKSLPDFYTQMMGTPLILSIAACPGSFYGRLFPTQFLNFVYSSNSLHWLSKARLNDEKGNSINKGNIHIAGNSPKQVAEAYTDQFREDFPKFLMLRAEEIVVGGRMVLIFNGRAGPDHFDRGFSLLWSLLSQSLIIMASQGDVDIEKLDSFDAHYYGPCKNEVEEEVKKQRSFELDRFEVIESNIGVNNCIAVSNGIRAIQENLIREHFGGNINIDKLFELFRNLLIEEAKKEAIKTVHFIVALRRKEM
ncbi:probable methyltransferase TCM_000336 [Impatiens glandulifera]|uniref:probable methyltransferase TCM_000336 n=1 Tax=Impatiens glandulifera TaxID=253017 RepID=UPI001FB1749B|nr:probable methyltransferase TCM_000336 [Impatiens glandulifera]